ncbi:MAG: translation elongation factor-like protein [Candidatus Liptonbacteria bacterium]|nr:translation elongation factor-like protein [Candidatus Liptonbacteria bacterium]
MPKKKPQTKKPPAKKVTVKVIKERPVGYVTHYFTKIKVAIIKFKKPVKVGDEIHIKGATTDFKQNIISMQYDHKEIKKAAVNKQVGVSVKKRVREGDMVYV